MTGRSEVGTGSLETGWWEIIMGGCTAFLGVGSGIVVGVSCIRSL